jgi:L-alanine-DL-glutamate epimerase-like enolase superfamily enzyme
LTLPAIVAGNQQTAAHMVGDVLKERLPIVDGPTWGIPTGPGLNITIDESALDEAAANYQRDGQFLPYQLAT